MPNFEDISRGNTSPNEQEDISRHGQNVPEIKSDTVENPDRSQVVPVEEPVMTSDGRRLLQTEAFAKTIKETNDGLARVRESLGVPFVEGDVPSVAMAKENLARLNAEKAVTSETKEDIAGWKGDWRAGGRPEGYKSITDQRERLEKGGFKLEKGLLQNGWVTKDFQEMARLTRKAMAQGLLTVEETDQLLQYNQEMVWAMDDFEDEQKKIQKMKDAEIQETRDTVLDMLKTNDVVVSKSGTRRVVEEVILFPGADGGGIVVCSTTRGDGKPYPERLTFKQIKDGLEKGVLEIQKS